MPCTLSSGAGQTPIIRPVSMHSRSEVTRAGSCKAFVTDASLLSISRNYCLRRHDISFRKKCKYLSLRYLVAAQIWRLECDSRVKVFPLGQLCRK